MKNKTLINLIILTLLSCNNDDKIEFKKDSKKLWGDYMKKMSTEFKIWSNAPENPQSN